MKLVKWLREAGTYNITILDNGSTYPPLLEWYKEFDITAVKFQPNLGPWSFWTQGMHLVQSTPYVVTDADIVPSDCCPKDLIERCSKLLAKHPESGKVGPGLRLDNIPDLSRDFITHGDGKGWEGEGVFWKRVCERGFNAPIDTTFAVYKARSPWITPEWNNIRLDLPYVVEHTPWYISKPFSEEEQYYRDHADHTWSHVTWPSPINS